MHTLEDGGRLKLKWRIELESEESSVAQRGSKLSVLTVAGASLKLRSLPGGQTASQQTFSAPLAQRPESHFWSKRGLYVADGGRLRLFDDQLRELTAFAIETALPVTLFEGRNGAGYCELSSLRRDRLSVL